MEVLLLHDIDNLGYAGDVKKVANGFGRNYLLPQNMAVLATPGALKQAETIRKVAEKQRATEMEDAKAISSQLEGLQLLFERRAGETGKLYGSVTSGDIAEAIYEQTEIEVDRRKVALAEPIRGLGAQEVTIKLMIDLATTITVEVLPLGGILERERLSAAEVAAIDEEAGMEAEPVPAPVEPAPEAVAEAEAYPVADIPEVAGSEEAVVDEEEDVATDEETDEEEDEEDEA